MTQSKHTPTPWTAVQYNDNKILLAHQPSDMQQPEVFISDMTCKADEIEANEANAAFIVKAVNCHDDLIEALKFYADKASYEFIHGTASYMPIEVDDGYKAREALTKAGAL